MGGEPCEGVGDLRICRNGNARGRCSCWNVAKCVRNTFVCLKSEIHNASSRIGPTRSGLQRLSVYMNKHRRVYLKLSRTRILYPCCMRIATMIRIKKLKAMFACCPLHRVPLDLISDSTERTDRIHFPCDPVAVMWGNLLKCRRKGFTDEEFVAENIF